MEVLAVAGQATLGNNALLLKHRRQLYRRSRVDDQLRLAGHNSVRDIEESVRLPRLERSKALPKLLHGSNLPFGELNLHVPSSLASQLGGLPRSGVIGVIECNNSAELWQN